MSIRKRRLKKGRPAYQVRLPGERAITFPTRRAAEEFELRRKIARRGGEQLVLAGAISFDEAADGYLERWRVQTGPASSTLDCARGHLRIWREAFGDRRLCAIPLVEAEDLIVEHAAGYPNAGKKALEWFKRVLRDAQRRGQQFDLALLQIEPIHNTNRQGIALDVELLQRLGSWFPEQIATLPEFVGSVGLRIGETLTLEDERVDIGRHTLFIPAYLCKERRDKTIELAEFEAKLLGEQLMLRPPGTSYVYPRAGGRQHEPGPWRKPDFYKRVWHPARDAAAREWRSDHELASFAATPFDGIVPHDLRHSAISQMAAGGMSPELIAARVGHSDGGKLILERYRHLFPDEMGRQLARYASARDRRLKVGRGLWQNRAVIH